MPKVKEETVVKIVTEWVGDRDEGSWRWSVQHGENEPLFGGFEAPKRMMDGSVLINLYRSIEDALVEKFGDTGPLVLTHHKVVVEVKRSYEFHGTRP